MRPRPLLLEEDQVDIKSLRFDAPGGCVNIGCSAVIRLTHTNGEFISDRNPDNDTVEVFDGVIVRG